MHRKFAVIAIFCIMLFAGCVIPEKIILRYDINADLTGTFSISLLGCRSTAEDMEDARTELDEFRLDIKSDTCTNILADIVGLGTSPEIAIVGNDSFLDISVSGEFRSLVAVLGALEADNMQITRNDEQFDFHASVDKNGIDEQFPMLIVLGYEGKIIRHNGTSFDREANTVTWDLSEISEISFSLKIEPHEDE